MQRTSSRGRIEKSEQGSSLSSGSSTRSPKGDLEGLTGESEADVLDEPELGQWPWPRAEMGVMGMEEEEPADDWREWKREGESMVSSWSAGPANLGKDDERSLAIFVVARGGRHQTPCSWDQQARADMVWRKRESQTADDARAIEPKHRGFASDCFKLARRGCAGGLDALAEQWWAVAGDEISGCDVEGATR